MSDLELMASLRALTMRARQEKKWLYYNNAYPVNAHKHEYHTRGR